MRRKVRPDLILWTKRQNHMSSSMLLYQVKKVEVVTVVLGALWCFSLNLTKNGTPSQIFPNVFAKRFC